MNRPSAPIERVRRPYRLRQARQVTLVAVNTDSDSDESDVGESQSFSQNVIDCMTAPYRYTTSFLTKVYAMGTPVQTLFGRKPLGTFLCTTCAIWLFCCRPQWVSRATVGLVNSGLKTLPYGLFLLFSIQIVNSELLSGSKHGKNKNRKGVRPSLSPAEIRKRRLDSFGVELRNLETRDTPVSFESLFK